MRFIKRVGPLFGALAVAQQFPSAPKGLEVVSSQLFKGAEISYKEVMTPLTPVNCTDLEL